jgi:hypothetical protein
MPFAATSPSYAATLLTGLPGRSASWRNHAFAGCTIIRCPGIRLSQITYFCQSAESLGRRLDKKLAER